MITPQQALTRLIDQREIFYDEMLSLMRQIMSGEVSAAQIAGILVGLRVKKETVGEISAAAFVMREFATKVPVKNREHLVDTCGTGGDRLRSINVSTIAALVVAATGAKVCKHGGRASSSAVGAADVLEALGVVADLGPAGVARCIDEVGMGFCFAPRFHPAMRFAAPIRRELGIPTVFNYLGPLANPGRARYQVVGVSDRSMADKMIGVLAANGAERAMIVYGDDGLDELSTTGPSTVHELKRDAADGGYEITVSRLDPTDLGFAIATLDDLRGGDASVNADAIRRVVAGDLSPHRDIAVLNAAASLVVMGRSADFPAGVALAREVIDDGRASEVLDALVRVTREAASAEE